MSRIREDIHQERDIRHQCKKCGNLWVGPASEEECPKCHAREYDESVLLKAIRGGDHLTIAEALGQVMRAKVRTRLAEEKVNVAATLLYPKIAEANITEGFRSGEKVVLAHCTVFGSYKALDGKGQYRTVPIGSTGEYVRAKDSTWSIVWFPEFYESASVKTEDLVPVSQAHLYERKMAKCSVCGKERTLDDEGLCHECWQDRKDKEKEELGEAADRCDAKDKSGAQCVLKPGHSGKHQGHSGDSHKIWESSAAAKNEKCAECGKPLTGTQKELGDKVCDACYKKNLNEATVSHHEVQRIYDEIGDVGETELLCGISNLRVNGNGQVISYICEGRSLEQGIGTSPENGIWLKGKYPLDHPELNQFGRPKPEPNKYCWQCQKPIRNLSRCPFCSEKQ